jgi:hypothetical protein
MLYREDPQTWLSPSDIAPALIGNHVQDAIKHSRNLKRRANHRQDHPRQDHPRQDHPRHESKALTKGQRYGLEFEAYIINFLEDLIGSKIYKVSKYVVPSHEEELIAQKYLRNGHDIMQQVPLSEESLKLRGVADLVIKTSYLSKILKDPPEISASHIVCEIKSFRIPEKIPDIYRCQLYFYSYILNKLTGQGPPEAGLLWDRSGVRLVKYCEEDVVKLNGVFSWLSRLSNEGHLWTVDEPHIVELCADAKIKTTAGCRNRDLIRSVAKRQGDLTLLPYVTQSVRNRYISKTAGTKRLPNLGDNITAEDLGFKGKKAKVINECIKLAKAGTSPKDIRFPYKVSDCIFFDCEGDITGKDVYFFGYIDGATGNYNHIKDPRKEDIEPIINGRILVHWGTCDKTMLDCLKIGTEYYTFCNLMSYLYEEGISLSPEGYSLKYVGPIYGVDFKDCRCISGSQAVRFYKAGDWEPIIEYNRRDCELIYKIATYRDTGQLHAPL